LAAVFFAVAITFLLDQVAKSTEPLEQLGNSPPGLSGETHPVR